MLRYTRDDKIHFPPSHILFYGTIASATAVAAGGGHSCAILSEGNVQCWGYNGNGQLGSGTTEQSSLPIDASEVHGIVSAITIGTHRTCIVLKTGAAQCWGSNEQGGLGDGTTDDSITPVSVSGIDGELVRVR